MNEAIGKGPFVVVEICAGFFHITNDVNQFLHSHRDEPRCKTPGFEQNGRKRGVIVTIAVSAGQKSFWRLDLAAKAECEIREVTRERFGAERHVPLQIFKRDGPPGDAKRNEKRQSQNPKEQ
jgi:hypothetical protein